jgi:PAS domain S-box-containing protein
VLSIRTSPDIATPVASLPPELAFVEGLRDALVILDADWCVTFLNARARSAVAAAGLDPAAMVGWSIWAALPTLERSPAAEELRRVRAGGGPAHFDYHDDAKRRSLEIDAMVVGDVLAVYWRDVTDVRRAELARAASEAEMLSAHRRLEELVAGAPLAIMVLDNLANVIMWNPAAEEMFGWTSAEVLGKLLPTIPEEESEAFESLRVRELAGEPIRSLSARRRRKDGTVLDVQISTAPLRDRDDTVVGVIGMIADVSEQRRLEVQLRTAQKMEAVGLLAGGVAHDFNNLLTAIKGFASLLQMTIPASDESHEFVEEIVKATDRAAGLTAQLLAFSRRQLLRPERLDLNARVRDLERMLALLVSEGGELVLQLDPALGLVLADPGQVEQIVLNLAVNARDAIAGRSGGRIGIATSNVSLRDEFSQWRVAPAPGEYVRLDVSDDGVGMDAATQARIFDPFFTTKAPGQGTGLGLATVYGIVKQSNGFVWVQSAPGQGTTISVYLPRAADAAPAVDDGPPALRHGDVVLLVEDEDGVRRVARRTLELQGYRVIEAADGAQAVELARSTPSIGLLLTDVMMPGMLGPEVAAAVHAVVPGLPVLYMSGHAEDVARVGMDDPALHFLAKPFAPNRLAEKVREVLATARR